MSNAPFALLCKAGSMLVWLTDWQLAEDHLLISKGDVVEWTLYPADRDWVARLFGDRFTIDWQLDAYGDAADQSSIKASGTVTELREVRCRQLKTDEGLAPADGEATLHSVANTAGSSLPAAGHVDAAACQDCGPFICTFSYTTTLNQSKAGNLYGYVLVLLPNEIPAQRRQARPQPLPRPH